MALEVSSGKEKIAIINVRIFERVEGGFQTAKSDDNHEIGEIHAVPKMYEEFYDVGDSVILRAKAVAEKLMVEGVEYSFVQPLDILCKVKEN